MSAPVNMPSSEYPAAPPQPGTAFDYIVCGGGTAGCVVARRLSDDPDVKVLVLEAGGDDAVPGVRDSTIWMSNIGSNRDWGFRAQSSGALNGRAPILPMGKVLGGGSSVNGLIWARGHKNDFDSWAEEVGDPRWRYDLALRLCRRSLQERRRLGWAHQREAPGERRSRLCDATQEPRPRC